MIVHDDALARDFINPRIGAQVAAPSYGWCSVRHGEVVAAILANNFNGFDIHIAGAGLISAGLLREVARGCFVNLGVSRVTAITRSGNARARRFLLGAGFVEEAALPGQYGSEWGIQYRLPRDAQRLVRLP